MSFSTEIAGKYYHDARHIVFFYFLFLCSTLVIASSYDFHLVVVWVLLWVLTLIFAANSGAGWLVFYLAFYFFYPSVSSVFNSLDEWDIVLTVFVLAFVLSQHGKNGRTLGQSRILKFVLLGWLTWALMAWLPVILENYIMPGVFPALKRDTTLLKTTLPILTSVLFALIPLSALNANRLRTFWKALIAFAFIYLVLSYLRYAFNYDFIPQNYTSIREFGFRMTGFSMPDANGFARQLLFPGIYLFAYLISSKRERAPGSTIVLVLIVVAILMSFSRTAYASFAAGILFLVLISRKKLKSFATLAFTASVLFVAAAASGAYQYFLPGANRSSLVNLYGRIDIYEIVLRILSGNPFFGAFPGGYDSALIKYGYSPNLPIVSAHNTFLSIAAEWGIPLALLLLFAIFATIVIGLSNVKKIKGNRGQDIGYLISPLAFASTSLAVSYLIHGMTEIVPTQFIFFNLGIAIFCSVALRSQVNRRNIADQPEPS